MAAACHVRVSGRSLISANGGEQLALQRHTGNVCVPAMKESSQAPVLTIVG